MLFIILNSWPVRLFWFGKQSVLSSKTSSFGPTNSSAHCGILKGGVADLVNPDVVWLHSVTHIYILSNLVCKQEGSDIPSRNRSNLAQALSLSCAVSFDSDSATSEPQSLTHLTYKELRRRSEPVGGVLGRGGVANSAIAAARKTGSLIPSWPQYLARHYQPPNRWGPWIRHPRWQSQINTIQAVDLLHYCHRWRLFQIQTLKKHGKEQGWIKSCLLSWTPTA